ncbi:MAG: leucine-rich repeat protein [Prevotella sp.]|nr:leucine-rich repeat protein [Prevotella sp.]
MKKVIAFMLAAILYMPGHAFDFEKNGMYYNITSLQKQTVEVTKGDSPYSGEIVVPNEVEYSNKTFSVTRLGDYAFESSTITSISLPLSIREIGHHVFQNSPSLSSFTIPSQVNQMGVCCFNGCYGLREIIYEDSDEPFWSPYNSGVSGNRAYYVSCPIENAYIGRNIYQGGDGYNDGAFYRKTNLTNLIFGSKITSVTGNYLFYECTGLKAIRFPENVSAIGEYVFVKCSGLEDIIFSEGLKTIGMNSFEGCTSIKSLLFPSTIEAISTGAFQNCTKITQVFCKATTPPSIEELTFPGIVYLNATLYVPIGTKSLYTESVGWKDFVTIVETDNFEDIPDIPEKPKCATPTISYTKGKLTFACDTEGAECVASIGDRNVKTHYGNEISLVPTYTLTVFAKADGYENSDTVTAMMTWSDKGLEVKNITVDAATGNKCDVNDDGAVDVADIATVISEMATRARSQGEEDE